jgi:hypothetical protein
LNFGEIAQNSKELMEEFQKTVKSSQKLDSIADMKVCAGFRFKRMGAPIFLN